mmetsp:Transcript_33484/g.41020  ORF Transcript_33484/g.41020 Transcript_33484/m.41020 type:complete len:430 (+) Transcript_33484:137-1426(+)|eukprot:CAMPEP_0172506288 /NCGR_PEP_ID=MMETSP1066-20121228/193630_1 /TAXON_ID=671091 /ORGANISM="Coscinodiscus wailesii, Strain CCMP2513" /LENGTH=429 /DNA_ID=CAMNT_0013283255 /DNA_START=57 /DNA_END=1349 /DNA_ORIENTATION=+
MKHGTALMNPFVMILVFGFGIIAGIYINRYNSSKQTENLELTISDYQRQRGLEWDKYEIEHNEIKNSMSDNKVLVGVYYYPWHSNGFHNGEGYLRSQLNPPQYPVLGEYDDTDPATIRKHLTWSLNAKIGLWVTSWWGPDRPTDSTTRNVIMNEMKGKFSHMRFALHYETKGRLKDSNPNPIEVVKSDMKYLCEHYFPAHNYYRINGRPVLVIYLTRVLEKRGTLEETVMNMRRTAARECGEDLYIIGDHIFWKAPDLGDSFMRSFIYLDAATNYDVYGSMIHGREITYAGKEIVNEYYDEQKKWRQIAWEHGCRFVPAVSPGFNDRGVRLEKNHTALSRRLYARSPEGSLFRHGLRKAFTLLDPLVENLVLVNSFNEWHEDTQIEPVSHATTTTDSPIELTNGLTYNPYGMHYINILTQEVGRLVWMS